MGLPLAVANCNPYSSQGSLISPFAAGEDELVLMDNDGKEREPLEGCIADETPLYFNTQRRPCSWHLVNRGLKSHPLGETKTSGAAAQKVVDTFAAWIYSWMTPNGGVESEEEYLLTTARLIRACDGRHRQSRNRSFGQATRVVDCCVDFEICLSFVFFVVVGVAGLLRGEQEEEL